MILNLWSTARTGSTWYAKYLQSVNLGSILINELFNDFGHTQYFCKDAKGNSTLSTQYYPGCFYDELTVNEVGVISVIEKFEEKTRTYDEDVTFMTDVLASRDKSVLLIMHNHVAPMPDTVREMLTASAIHNVYLYRKDKRLQLASLAIAVATRRFNIRNKDGLTTEPIADIDTTRLVQLMDRIKIWDSIPKYKSIVLSYEDIPFVPDLPNFPIQQNQDHFSRLSDNIKRIIDELVTEYEHYSHSFTQEHINSTPITELFTSQPFRNLNRVAMDEYHKNILAYGNTI